MSLARGRDESKAGGGAQQYIPRSSRPTGVLRATMPASIDSNARIGPNRAFCWEYSPKTHPGLYKWRVELDQAGLDGIAQSGWADEVLNKLAYGDLVGDKIDVARSSFYQTANDNLAIGSALDRMSWCEAFDATVFSWFGSGPPEIWKVTAGNPTPQAFSTAGVWPGPKGATMHLAKVQIAGVPYIANCLNTNTIAPNRTLQFLDSATGGAMNESFAAGFTGDTSQCSWCIQVPNDKNAILAQFGNKIVRFNTDVAIGSATFADCETGIPLGGKVIGIVNVRGTPDIAVQVPVHAPSTGLLWDYTIGPSYRRSEVWLFSPRGFLVDKMPTVSPYVIFGTEFELGVVYCDEEADHFYRPPGGGRRNDIAIDPVGDKPANSNHRRICRGHAVNGGKFYWYEDILVNGGNTIRRTMEWDPRMGDGIRGRRAQVSSEITLTDDIVLTVASNSMPYSTFTNQLYYMTKATASEANGVMYRQHQPRPGVMGYSERHTHGAVAATGEEFDQTSFGVWPKMRFRELDGGPMWLDKIISPSVASIATGQQNNVFVTTRAKVVISELSSNQSRTFDTREYASRTPEANDFFQWTSKAAYFFELQPKVQVYQQTGGTDDSRYACNGLPVIMEGYGLKGFNGAQDPRVYQYIDWEARGKR